MDPPGTLRVIAFVVKCTDKHCSADTNQPLGFSDLGKVATGTAVKVEMLWDKTSHKFFFTRGAQVPQFVDYGAQGVSDLEDPDCQIRARALGSTGVK